MSNVITQVHVLDKERFIVMRYESHVNLPCDEDLLEKTCCYPHEGGVDLVEFYRPLSEQK